MARHLCAYAAFLTRVYITMELVTSCTAGIVQDHYIGCFYATEYQGAVLSNGPASKIFQCIELCRTNSNLTYAGLQNGTLCLCRDEYGVQVSDDNCNLQCSPKGKKACSGVIRYPKAYTLLSVCPKGKYGSHCHSFCHCKQELQCNRMHGRCPTGCHRNWAGNQCNRADLSQQYIGCFRDISGDPAMSDCIQCGLISIPNSIDKCTEACVNKDRTYIGVQNSWKCFCGDSYDKHGPLDETSCNMSCSINLDEVCGGTLASSVYTVCPAGHYGISCAGRCHCLNGGRCAYSNGYCLPIGTQCAYGWKGNNCNIRDCDQNNGDCSSNEKCYSITLNSETITACRCSEGYQREHDKSNCTDVDECQLLISQCDSESTICYNTLGGYDCRCKPGYTTKDQYTCTDIEECQLSYAQCDTNSTVCNNTAGGYECSCKPGYAQKGPHKCTDIDECLLSRSQCDSESTICYNVLGGYDCNCKPGYISNDPYTCTDIDECHPSHSQCDTNSTICNNAAGGYECSCKPGYTQIGPHKCTDIDECLLLISQCDSESTICYNALGGYDCSCKPGYITKDPYTCTDIDECKLSYAQCDTNSTVCNNTAGGYNCSCKPGYTPKGSHKCTDIDECQLSISHCDDKSTICNNTVGGYECNCKPGYTTKDQYTCTDIGKCQLSLPLCDTESTICSNTDGGYECSCRPGYTRKDQYTCADTVFSLGAVADASMSSIYRFSTTQMLGAIFCSALGMMMIFIVVFIAVYLYRRKQGSGERTRISNF